MQDFSLKYTKLQMIIIGALFVIDVIWLNVANIKFYYDINDWLLIGLVLSFLSIVIYAYGKHNPNPSIITLYKFCLILFLFNFFAEIFCYLLYTLKEPLADPWLAALDAKIGFHAPDLVYWFEERPLLHKISGVIYDTFMSQFLIIFFYLALRNQLVDLEQFVMIYFIAILVTFSIAKFYPAAGPSYWYQFEINPEASRAVKRIFELRDQILDLRVVDGIVTFPSYHTTAAILYAFALRHQSKLIFIPATILNGLMIFSCLVNGGHYLVDLFAGMAVFAVAYLIEKRLSFYYERARKNQRPSLSKKPALTKQEV